ncbi:MAG TPA: hypothetical protein VF815_36675 [Myxococcaceae bacterium]|jgi:hypothetical protein
MKISKTKLLVAGLLAGSLTFMGCKSNDAAERTDGTTEGTSTGAGTGTDTGTGTTGEQGTGTGTNPGTGGSGTKQSDDNMRMPYEDPLRTPEDESIRDAESEPGVHEGTDLDPGAGVGGSGVDTGMESDIINADPNEGGNIDDDFRSPDMPADPVTPEDRMMDDDLSVPEGSR